MAKYELAIAVKDASYAPGRKEGDIVSIKPYPRNCGRKVIDRSLVVIMECSISDYRAVKQRLRSPLWDGGLVEGVDWREIYTRRSRPLKPGEDDIDLDVYPMKDYVVDMKTGKPMPRPAKLAKRRFKIPFTALGSINMVKVQNESYIYQPFKKASQLVEKFDGKDGKYNLETKDVDCVSTGVSEEQEKVFQWSALDNLVVDKYTDTYVSP